MTVLDRLVRKGKLSRRKAGRAFLYRPEASRDEMRRAAIRELVDALFNGSERDLVDYLTPVNGLANAVAAGAEDDPRIDTVLL
jgi:predicted transcriptional regulator